MRFQVVVSGNRVRTTLTETLKCRFEPNRHFVSVNGPAREGRGGVSRPSGVARTRWRSEDPCGEAGLGQGGERAHGMRGAPRSTRHSALVAAETSAACGAFLRQRRTRRRRVPRPAYSAPRKPRARGTCVRDPGARRACVRAPAGKCGTDLCTDSQVRSTAKAMVDNGMQVRRSKTSHASLCAARTLKRRRVRARVTPSQRQEHLRAACSPRREESRPKPAPPRRCVLAGPGLRVGGHRRLLAPFA